jgi:hypothetical protein
MDEREEALKQIAFDLFCGRIFCDRQLTRAEDAHLVFMPLALMNGEQIKALLENPPGLIFEYLSKAGPMCVNGCPTFFSMQLLSMEDAKRVFEFYEQFKTLRDQIK